MAHSFGTGPSQAEPEDVSALRASVPCAPNHEARIQELAAVEAGWDGYRSRPVNPYVLERIRPLLNLADTLELQPWITPMSNGAVMLERAGEDDWSLEVNTDGSFDFYARISCTWRAKPNAEETAAEFLRFAAAHFRSSLRMNAQAIEARRAETLGSVHESAVAKPCAQPPEQSA